LGIEGVLSEVNSRMSTYLPRSDLSMFSSAGINTDVSVSQKTVEVVNKALTIASLTNGYFDPTVAPLVDLWGFGPTVRNTEVPQADVVEKTNQLVGYQALSVDFHSVSLSKTEQRELDLSAIAKGYAVDLVAGYLEQEGHTNYLVEVGGEMRFSGVKPENKAWRIAIEKPDPTERSAFRILELNEGAVATSGDYRNFFELDGQRFSHTINPKTGYPVKHDLASVTVIMDDCIDADAFATAFMAMGKKSAMALSEKENIASFFIYKDGDSFKSVQSSQFTELFGNEGP